MNFPTLSAHAEEFLALKRAVVKVDPHRNTQDRRSLKHREKLVRSFIAHWRDRGCPWPMSFFLINGSDGICRENLSLNEGRNFVLNYVSPLKIRCFFGFAAMPRRGIGGFFRRTDRADSRLPAAAPVRLTFAKSKVFTR
jgi:hypothetical protein